MTDEVDNKPARKPLTLRKTETGAVKQSFSHGRSKTVVVEKKRRRMLTQPGEEGTKKAPLERRPAVKPAEKPSATAPAHPANKETEAPGTLSKNEREARAAALKHAQEQEQARAARAASERAEREAREAEAQLRLEEERARLEQEEKRKTQDTAARKKVEEENRHREEEEEARRIAENASKNAREIEQKVAEEFSKDKDNPLAQLGGRLKTKKNFADDRSSSAKSRDTSRRRTGKLTISNALDDDERQRSLASVKRARERERKAREARGSSNQTISREVIIPETITVQELAQRMSIRAVDLVKELMKQGQMVTANAVLDADTAELVTEELGHTVKRVAEADVEAGLLIIDDDPANLQPRPPVVTIMGHVDHGKTSLLDALRQTDIVAGEAGGITQHIGAYQVTTTTGTVISFLDTPGHAAFTQMRARGASVTDIVVIVVAADDSVMPQTEEAIAHAKAAGVPIIIAINKIDKPDATPDKVRTDLLQYEIQVESLGGDIQDVECSALERINLDGVLEAIALQAELLELTANPDRRANGAIVEAQLDKGRGPVATVLVQSGSLERGDILVCGSEWGKVRAITDDKGMQVKTAGPSMPVEILGLNGVPDPGEQFFVVENEAKAREVADYRQRKRREQDNAKSAGTSLEQMMAQLQDAEIKELPIVIKGDVQGSVEAISASLQKMSTQEVRVRLLHSGVGGISESDIILAQASMAPVIGFNVRANRQARDAAEAAHVEIRYYSVIYDLLDDLKAALSGMLTPELRETFLGNAEILEVFNISKLGKVAGCRVVEGQVRKGAKVRLIRDSVVIHEGELSQLKRFKDDVNDVPVGQECGMSFANYDDLKAGDTIECFSVEEIARTL